MTEWTIREALTRGLRVSCTSEDRVPWEEELERLSKYVREHFGDEEIKAAGTQRSRHQHARPRPQARMIGCRNEAVHASGRRTRRARSICFPGVR